MSLGSFVQGAFQGYSFGEDVKDRKTKRERDAERFEREKADWDYTDELRGRQRENWDWTDEQRGRQRQAWGRADEERREREEIEDEQDRIREDGYQDWLDERNGASDQPVPENTPQGEIRVPLGAPGDDTPRLNLTDIEPVKGRYSEEEQRQLEREARSNGMTPDEYRRSITGEERPANVDRTDDARAGRGTGRTGSRSDPRSPQARRPSGGTTDTRTALTPDANNRRATDYPYNPSSPESRRGVMVPGGEPVAPRPPADQPRGTQAPNAMDPRYRPPVFAEIVAPAASRVAPTGPITPETVAAEAGNEDLRADGAMTYGGGAQPRPSSPGMPVDPRVPLGPEAGQPQRQANRNARPVASGRGVPEIPTDTAQDTGTLDAPQSPDRSTRQAVTDVDPTATAFMQDVQEFQRNGDIVKAVERIKTGLATGEYGAAASPVGRAIGRVRDYFTASPSEGEAAAAERQRAAAALEWYQSEEAMQVFSANPDLLSVAAQDPIGFLDQQGPMPQGAPAADAPPAGAAAAAEPPRPTDAPAQPPAPSADQPPTQPIDQVRESLADNANADNEGKAPEVSEEDRVQGARTFREYYQAEIAPRQIEALYRRGEIEEAEQLQTWLEDERSQALQENYARAVHAASIGDERGFFDYLGKVYNSFDDGYRFIPDQSDLFKNDSGQTVARVTLENTTTGELFTQDYEGGEELIQQVLTQMDPISVFETLKAQAQAEAEAQAEQRAWEIGEARRRIEEGYETPADRRAAYTEAYKELSQDVQFMQMSDEEKHLAVLAHLRAAQSFSLEGTSDPRAPVYLGR